MGPEDAVVAEFLELYAEDRARGAVRALEAYQARFEGFEGLIAERFRRLEEPSATSEPGRELDRPPAERVGPFRLERLVGIGGHATVWLAHDDRVGRRVAVKLQQHLRSLPVLVERFRREAQVSASLDHPRICSVLEADLTGEIPYIAMPFVEGDVLTDRIRSARERGLPSVLPVPECTRMLQRLAAAVGYAHDRGVVHRDLKPGNVMLTDAGDPVVLDFGIARLLDDDTEPLTEAGDVLGTAPYMAPEQIDAAGRPADARTDVWALGATCFECLCLERPFAEPTRAGLFRAILEREPPDVRRLNPAVPPDLALVVGTALAKDPDARYASASALAEDLRRVLAKEPVTARPVTAWTRLRRWTQRNPLVAASTTVAALALVGGLVVSLALLFERDRAVDRYEGMSDVVLVRELLEAKDGLLPRRSWKVPAMSAWLDRAQELRSRLPLHQATLAEVEARGVRRDGEEPVFEDAKDRWLHEVLTGLVGRLEQLGDGIASVESARRRAEEIHRETIVEARDAWASSVDAAAARGIALEPVEGLVPLGEDPDTGLWHFRHVETGLVLVLLPGGSFWQGAQKEDPADPNYDPGAFPREKPCRVELVPFLVSRHEMTQEQWRRAASGNPSRFALGGTHPVEQVTWERAKEVLERLGLALPTEAQWEYACRAGTQTPWHTGSDPRDLRHHANVADAAFERSMPPTAEAAFATEPWDDGHAQHAPVGSFRPNAFGLFDMHGNVAEWCLDGPAPYTNAAREGDGYRSGFDPSRRGTRGGSFMANAAMARSAGRAYLRPRSAALFCGVRPALNLRRP